MEEQSDTPRTDAAAQFVSHFGWQVHADFARDLERELATATRERDEARAEVEKLRVALFFVIEDADVWHDVARGGQSDNITADIRALAATEAKP